MRAERPRPWLQKAEEQVCARYRVCGQGAGIRCRLESVGCLVGSALVVYGTQQAVCGVENTVASPGHTAWGIQRTVSSTDRTGKKPKGRRCLRL